MCLTGLYTNVLAARKCIIWYYCHIFIYIITAKKNKEYHATLRYSFESTLHICMAIISLVIEPGLAGYSLAQNE